MSKQNINIDTTLNLLNRQINSIETRINNDSGQKVDKPLYEGNEKDHKLYINFNQFENPSFNESEEDEEDVEDYEIMMNTTITSANTYGDSKNRLLKTTSNHSASSRTSFASLPINTDVLHGKQAANQAENPRDASLPQTKSFVFSSSSNRRNSNENLGNSGMKSSFNLTRNNSRLKSVGNHSYLDSSYNNNSNVSSPFIKHSSQFGSSPFLSNNSSPFAKNNYSGPGLLQNNNGSFNQTKRSSVSTTSSFKRSTSLKRTNSLKKYSSTSNTSNNINSNIYGANNNGTNCIGNSSNSPNNFITNLHSRLELDLKGKQQANIGSIKDSVSNCDIYEDPYDFISKQPPPPLLIPYGSSGNSQIPLLTSSTTGSSVNSNSSNHLGLFVIDSDDNKEDSVIINSLELRKDLNKTPIAPSNSKLQPKTPDRTNDLLYKLNTDLNFETESVEVMSAMSQTSLSSNVNAFKTTNSMIFNKYDLLKLNSEVTSNLTRETSEAENNVIEDAELKQIIHLPTMQDKYKYNKDGITVISSDFLRNMMIDRENSHKKDMLIIDCRFPKEYENGHIMNSINIFDFENLVSLLKEVIKNSSSGELVEYKIVLYCEFSQYRSPQMSKFLRKLDRLINLKYWPYLIFPDLFILEGGICNFKNTNQSLILGNYCSMDDSYTLNVEELDNHLTIFKKNVEEYLGANDKNSSNNNVNSGFISFDKMVDLKNDIMKVIKDSSK